MFRLNGKYEIIRKILNCDYKRYSPSEISTITTPISQIYITILKEVSVISLFNKCIDLDFDVVHAATNNRYEDGNDIKLVKIGPIVLVSNYKLTTSSRKHPEYISHTHTQTLWV